MKKILLFALLLATVICSNGQSFVFVFLNKRTNSEELPKEQLDKLMDGHMNNIKRLASENKLLAAGPFEGGGGIFVFNSTSKEQVKEWLDTDPAVQAKRWDIEMFSYRPVIGSVCAVSEPIKMIMYNFVRYEVNITKYTISKTADGMKDHDEYIKKLAVQGEVVAQGTFGQDEGGILVMRGELKKDAIEGDPAVQKGLLSATFKSLYIAQGAFCEK